MASLTSTRITFSMENMESAPTQGPRAGSQWAPGLFASPWVLLKQQLLDRLPGEPTHCCQAPMGPG